MLVERVPNFVALLLRSCPRSAFRSTAPFSSSGRRIGEKKQLGDEKDFAQKRDAELLRRLAQKTGGIGGGGGGGGGGGAPAAAASAPSLNAASVPFGAPILPFHHAFPVHSLAEAREFYRDLLGCEEGRSSKTWIVRRTTPTPLFAPPIVTVPRPSPVPISRRASRTTTCGGTK
jgi:hypothetical protein